MNMVNSWRQAYTELTDFIAEHSDIKLNRDHIYIPENTRNEFYQFFNTARAAFIEEKLPTLLNEAKTLSYHYLKAEDEVIKLLGLEDVTHPKTLHRFLHDPIDELTIALFDLTFDLLKAKIGLETFEEKALQNIQTLCQFLFLLAYEKWVIMCLIKLLAADRNLRVYVRHIEHGEYSIIQSSASEEEVSLPQESSHLSFDHTREALFVVTDFIIHSTKVDKNIAFRSEVDKAIATASNASNRREWYPYYSAINFGSGLTLVYLADEPDEISLVADAKRFCRPDLVIECREQKDWYENNDLGEIKFHHSILRPRLGTYVVSKEQVPEKVYREFMPEKASVECVPEITTENVSEETNIEQASEKPAQERDTSAEMQQKPTKRDESIQVLTVGFDQTKLDPIINSLTT
jgi:hypothetical protein